ncbi:MAG: hypothetical protein AB1351_01195 [Thermoproteota archaeon]
MTNLKHTLSVGLAAATLATVLPFFAGGFLLLQPGFAPVLVQAGLVPGAGPAWFAPAFGTAALVLGSVGFAASWKQRSFLVAGLLAASGVIFMIPSLIATGYLEVIVIPGPILGFITGLALFELGLAKGLRTAKTAMVIVR